MATELSPKRSVSVSSLVVGGALCVLAGVGVSAAIERYHSASQMIQVAGAATSATPQSLPDFASLAKKIGPSVVNVSTTQIRRRAQDPSSPFGGEDPGSQFWERFFGGPMPRGPQRQNGLGSGFIIDGNGTILTNYHVVDGAQKVAVTLSDGKNYDAKVIGKDQKSDIAVIKIDAGHDLPAVTFGDSDRLEVGEWVMAIGNPFGLDHTVTSGIVSAKGRQIGAGPYDNFIQTDASINPGNSGGPLINLRGEVVGINTAIFSQSGGNIGIGFAIPTNSVKELLPQLKDKGKVVRGYLGTTVQKITPEIADSLGLKQSKGALVAEVLKGSPAERAGIKLGDIITEFDRKEIKDSADLPALVARVAPGMTVQLKVLRDGKEVTLPLTVGEMKENEIVASTQEGDLGLAVQPVTPEIAESLGIDRAEGLVVTSVTPGSAADEAGLRAGDLIAQINRRPVKNLAEYNREIARSEKGKSVLFLVRRGQGSLFLALKR
ncbi:MAG TPA: DegQ family serine endoprotease [Candidatus Binatia bacterium]|jgi:serine protease Do|nr:DegQ family serine endoprotease [Candidatus Binatia bacterium]